MSENPIRAAIEALRVERAALDTLIAALEQHAGAEPTCVTTTKLLPAPRARAAKPRAKPVTPRGPRKTDKLIPTAESPAALLAWRKQVLAPVLKTKKGTPERGAAMRALADTELTFPDGHMGKLKAASFYLWLQQIEG